MCTDRILKRYLNFSLDKKGVEGQIYPILVILSYQTGMIKVKKF